MNTKGLLTKHGSNLRRIWMKIWSNNLIFGFFIGETFDAFNEHRLSYERTSYQRLYFEDIRQYSRDVHSYRDVHKTKVFCYVSRGLCTKRTFHKNGARTLADYFYINVKVNVLFIELSEKRNCKLFDDWYHFSSMQLKFWFFWQAINSY